MPRRGTPADHLGRVAAVFSALGRRRRTWCGRSRRFPSSRRSCTPCSRRSKIRRGCPSDDRRRRRRRERGRSRLPEPARFAISRSYPQIADTVLCGRRVACSPGGEAGRDRASSGSSVHQGGPGGCADTCPDLTGPCGDRRRLCVTLPCPHPTPEACREPVVVVVGGPADAVAFIGFPAEPGVGVSDERWNRPR